MVNLIKNGEEIAQSRRAGDVVAKILATLYGMILPGNNGLMLEKKAKEIMQQHDCQPNFLHYHGFPNAICVSINDQLVHGIPNNKPFCEGDLVSVDVGCKYQKMHADAAFTKIVGNGTQQDQALCHVGKKSLDLVIANLRPGVTVGDIGHIINSFVKKNNLYVTNQFAGHGIGKELHEEPEILNFGIPQKGLVLQKNMIICIEPMVMRGNNELLLLSDG